MDGRRFQGFEDYTRWSCHLTYHGCVFYSFVHLANRLAYIRVRETVGVVSQYALPCVFYSFVHLANRLAYIRVRETVGVVSQYALPCVFYSFVRLASRFSTYCEYYLMRRKSDLGKLSPFLSLNHLSLSWE